MVPMDFLAFSAAVVLAGFGSLMGAFFSKTKGWKVVFFLALGLFLLLIAVGRVPALHYRLAYSWYGRGRVELFLFSFCIPLMFGVVVPRFSDVRQRLMVGLLAAVGTMYFGWLPFLEFALMRPRLAALQTWRENEVCLQTTDFTCGPAAAVSALAQRGVHAEESELAIAAYCTPRLGTSVGPLVQSIESLYGDQGVRCRIVRFESVEQLQARCPVIVPVKYRFMTDHFVTVLQVDEEVVVADPLKGLVRYSKDDFGGIWRHVGIVVHSREATDLKTP